MSVKQRFFYSLVLILSLSACTTTQRDGLFNKLVDYKRWDVGVKVKTQQVDGLSFSYLVREPKSPTANPPTIVLLHGFSANKDNWLYFIEHFPEQFRIIVPDLAGHGESDGDTSLDYHLDQQAKRLNKLLNAIKLDHYHMVGNSMGGAITILYHRLYPSLLDSITLMNAAGVSGDTQSKFFKLLKHGENPLIAYDEASFERRMELIAYNPKGFPWPIKGALVRREVKRKTLNEKIFADMLATQEDFTENVIENSFAKLVKLKTPTLIMWGGNDRILDPSAVKRLKELAPHAEVVVFDNVGHVPMLEKPRSSAQHIGAFVEKAENKRKK